MKGFNVMQYMSSVPGQDPEKASGSVVACFCGKLGVAETSSQRPKFEADQVIQSVNDGFCFFWRRCHVPTRMAPLPGLLEDS